MPKIERLNKLRKELKREQKNAKDMSKASVITGYTANYALYVHEDQEARHGPGKQANYLMGPLVIFQDDIANVAVMSLKRGASVLQSLYLGALRLQRESMKVVPVSGWDKVISPPRQGSGHLRGSAFTKKES